MIRTGFWSDNLSSEILEDFYNPESSTGTVQETPRKTLSILQLSLAFRSTEFTGSLTSFHPSTSQIFRLWETLVKNVDPLIKVMHVPTIQQQLLQASVDLQNVSKEFEALMFSIYAAAVTSLRNEECLELTGLSKSQLLERYHTAAQQAIVRAELLRSLDIILLQAAVLFAHSVFQPFLSSSPFWQARV